MSIRGIMQGWTGWGALLIAAFAAAVPAHAAGTLAGTDIVNTATISFIENGSKPEVVRSNDAIVRVDEILDVVVSPLDGAASPAAPGDTGRALPFRVTNSGNGPEAFSLLGNGAITGDAFDPSNVRLALDSNNDGRYDPAVDVAYVAGNNDPIILPDASVTIFVVADLATNLADGDRGFAALAANAVTGTGAPGTGFAGKGEGGTDVLVGTTGATASAQGAYVASLTAPELTKTQSIVDPVGGSAPMPGAIITYTLTARYTGGLPTAEVRVRDPIPANTTYVAGSLRLGGQTLTDATDNDSGRVDAGVVEVALGSLTAGTTPVISFQVRIN